MIVNNYALELKYNSLGEPINPYKTMSMFAQITGSDKYVSSSKPYNTVFEVLAEKGVYFPKVGQRVNHIDGTAMTYDEIRDYSLLVARYRNKLHSPNVSLMRQMTPEVLSQKLRDVDAEAKEFAKVILFEKKGKEVKPDEIDKLIDQKSIEDVKAFIKSNKPERDSESPEIPAELDY
jgi:hypothetical protein